jgi:putative molybdopterin biosynthesis protein
MSASPLRIDLRVHRHGRGLTQDALASRVGISRQALGAIERGEAVPSVEVALRLGAVLGVPVEGLFRLATPAASDPPPAEDSSLPPGTRVRESSVAGTPVLVPAEGRSGAGPELASGVVEAGGLCLRPLPGPPSAHESGFSESGFSESGSSRQVILAGCDPATTLLQGLLRQKTGIELLWMPAGSRAALFALGRGRAHLAGFHLHGEGEEEGPSGLLGSLPFRCTVVGFAVWEQGIMLRPGNPLGINGVGDLARPDLRFLNREAGSGSRAMLDRALRRAGVEGAEIPGYHRTAASGHWSVAQGVASGAADAGVGIRAAARSFGLGWAPLEEERYDLVIPDHLLDDPGVAAVLDLLGSSVLRAQVESLGGYDVGPMGLPA